MLAWQDWAEVVPEVQRAEGSASYTVDVVVCCAVMAPLADVVQHHGCSSTPIPGSSHHDAVSSRAITPTLSSTGLASLRENAPKRAWEWAAMAGALAGLESVARSGHEVPSCGPPDANQVVDQPMGLS